MGPLCVDVWLSSPPEAARERAVELAATGVDGLFSFENAHDVFFPLTLAATSVACDLMTNVAIAFPRSPMHLAHAAYDLQLLSRGRFRLGLGTQVRAHIERRYGSTWSHPVARMRDTVLATKAILGSWQEGSRLEHRGPFWTHSLMTPAFNPGPNPYGTPKVLVGALGPKMTAMAADVADGLLLMPFNSARHLRERTMPALEGRREDFEIVAEVIVAMGSSDDEIAAARAGARGLLSFYGSTPAYRAVLDVEGWGDLQPELNALSKRGLWKEMTGLIDDAVVHTLAVAGTPRQCAEQIRERFGAIAQRVCCYFPGYAVTDQQIADLVAEIKR